MPCSPAPTDWLHSQPILHCVTDCLSLALNLKDCERSYIYIIWHNYTKILFVISTPLLNKQARLELTMSTASVTLDLRNRLLPCDWLSMTSCNKDLAYFILPLHTQKGSHAYTPHAMICCKWWSQKLWEGTLKWGKVNKKSVGKGKLMNENTCGGTRHEMWVWKVDRMVESGKM